MVPKTAQDGSKTATRRPKMAQESPKMAQDSAKMAPRWHQESPKSSQEPKAPKSSKKPSRNPLNLGSKIPENETQNEQRNLAKPIVFSVKLALGASLKRLKSGSESGTETAEPNTPKNPTLFFE